MKKLSIFLIILGFSLLFPINNASADIWAKGVSDGPYATGGWFDAEKQAPDDGYGLVDDDDKLCWAASAADILMWSGWNAGYADEDDTFEFFIDEDPVDTGGYWENAWNFWFDGSETGGHFAGSSHTGYYSTAEYTANYWEETDGGSDVLADISVLLQDNWGVGIAVRGNMAHAVTLWGLDTDADGNFTGLWMTDSDNNKGGTDRRLATNTLDYYGVTLSGGRWYFDSYHGTGNYIHEIQALQFVPVPGAILLGILGLSVAGVKLRKFA